MTFESTIDILDRMYTTSNLPRYAGDEAEPTIKTVTKKVGQVGAMVLKNCRTHVSQLPTAVAFLSAKLP